MTAASAYNSGCSCRLYYKGNISCINYSNLRQSNSCTIPFWYNIGNANPQRHVCIANTSVIIERRGHLFQKVKDKMSQAKAPPLVRQMTEEEIQEQNTKLKYLEEEFNCMDVIGNNVLNYGEFVRLMRLLRYPTGHEGAKQIWLKQLGKNERSIMTKDEYVKLMTSDTTLEKLTSVWRCVYEEFDHDHSGWASKQDVVNGLENSLGIPVKGTLKEKIDAMDENGDGKIYYSNFLRMQLHLIQKQGSITHDTSTN